MTIRNVTLTAATVVLAAGLAGCWIPRKSSYTTPGSTRGRRIPLLAQSASARTDTLTKRFQLVQADR